MKTNWDQVEKDFNALVVGAIYIAPNKEQFLKPLQSKAHHLDGMFIHIGSGIIQHFSTVLTTNGQ